MFRDIFGEKDFRYAQSLGNLGTLYYDTQNYQKAEELMRKAYSTLLEIRGEEDSDTQNWKSWLEDIKEQLNQENTQTENNSSTTEKLSGIFANQTSSNISDKEAIEDYLNEKYGKGTE